MLLKWGIPMSPWLSIWLGWLRVPKSPFGETPNGEHMVKISVSITIITSRRNTNLFFPYSITMFTCFLPTNLLRRLVHPIFLGPHSEWGPQKMGWRTVFCLGFYFVRPLLIWLVVSTYPSEEWWSSSVGMMTFPMESHYPFHGSSHHQPDILFNHRLTID